jgi:hypothetical protein
MDDGLYERVQHACPEVPTPQNMIQQTPQVARGENMGR